MKITEIFANNFKIGDCTQPLTGKDLFIGSNGCGKSSKAEAVIFSMLGYIPNTDKQFGEIHTLATSDSNPTMSTGIKISNGDTTFQIERSITKKITHKRTGDEEIRFTEGISVYPPKGEKKLDEKKMRIATEIGSFPLMFDFNAFKQKTDMEKREFIYSLTSNSTEWDKSKVEIYLRSKLLTSSFKENSPDLYNQMESILKDALAQYFDGDSLNIEQGIDSICSWVSNQYTHWNDEQTRCSSSVKKLSQLKTSISPTQGNLVENEALLKKLQKSLIEVEKECAVKLEMNRNSLRLYNQTNNKIKVLEATIDSIKKELQSNSKEALQKEILSLQGKIRNVNDNNINTLRKEIQCLKSTISIKLQEKDKILSDGLAEKATIENTQAIINKITEHGQFCILNTKIKCNNDFSKYIEYASKTINSTKIKKDKLLSSYYSLSKEIQELNKKLSERELFLEKTIDDDRKTQSTNLTITSRINTLNNSINQIQANAKTLELKTNELINLKKELSSTPRTENEDTEIVLLHQQITGINNNISELNELINIQRKTAINDQNLNKAIIDNKIATNKVTCFTILKDQLGPKNLKGEIIKSNLHPIESLIQKNLNILGINNTFFFECESEKGKEIFKFGWINNLGHKITFNHLSEGEKISLMIAFLVAIIEKVNPKLKVLIIDNIVNVDAFNLKNIIKGLDKMTSKLDNIILLGCLDSSVASSLTKNTDFKIWNLENTTNKINIQSQEDEAI